MPLPWLLLNHHRTQSPPAARLEGVLAVGRAFLTVTGLAAIYIDATEPARLAAVTHSVLSAYAVYSLVVLVLVHRSTRITARHGQILHGLDIVWTSVLTGVSEGPLSPFFLFFLFVVLAAAYRWGFRETLGTAAVTVAVFLVQTLVGAIGPWSAVLSAPAGLEVNRTIIRATYLLITGFLLGYLAERDKQLRADAERTRVARELHDGTIQSLLGIELKMEALRRTPDRGVAAIHQELSEVQQLLRSEILSLRELMQTLRPIELDSVEQLPDALAAMVRRFERDTGISARFVATGSRPHLPPATAVELVRIVQEALVNVRKHSRARNVLVRLAAQNGSCNLVIEDDGCGFDFDGRLSARELDERRTGPAIIKERARIAGAQLAVDSTRGAGARVELAFSGGAHV
jgi:signal transduction histidine kinase